MDCDDLIEKYKSLFDNNFSTCKDETFEIKISKTEDPINEEYDYLESKEKKLLKKKVKQFQESGYLKLSDSEWSSPACIKEIGDRLEIFVDYSELNTKILNDYNYNLPGTNEVINRIRESNYFSKIVIRDGLHQIKLDPNSRRFTAFDIGKYRYEWKIVPYGLKGANKYLHSLVENCLKNVDQNHVVNYQGHILIFKDNDHIQLLEEIFKCLEKKKLKIDYPKSNFYKRTVDFLGYEIDRAGISIGYRSFYKIIEFIEPDSMKKLKKFLHLISNYINFVMFDIYIDNRTILDEIKEPKDGVLCLSEKQKDAFFKLKSLFSEKEKVYFGDL